MLAIMMRSNVFWALLLTCGAGFWADRASAQSDSSGDWFAGSGNGVAPPDPAAAPSDPGSSDDSAPPPDFQTPSPEPSDSDVAQAPPPDAQTEQQAAQDRAQGAQHFTPELAPYGYWIDDPWYGRVWVPSQGVVGAGFSPYVTGGHWALTPTDQWLWTSDYPFGWVTFHYGRWAWCAGGVWGWVPGYVYAPAWVQFRVGSAGYIGWGPLPPYYGWRHGRYVAYGYRPAPVVYVPTRYAFERSVQPYVVRDRYRARSIGYQTHPYRPVLGVGFAANVGVRSPSPAEAHVPARVLPAQRVLAQPRFSPATAGSRVQLSAAGAAGSYPYPGGVNAGTAGGGYSVRSYTLSGTRPLPSGAARPRAGDPQLPNRTLRALPAQPNAAPRPVQRAPYPAPAPRYTAPGARSTWQGFQGPTPMPGTLRSGARPPFAASPLAPAPRAQPIAPGAPRAQPIAPRTEGGARQRPTRRTESNERGRGRERGSFR